ncbi:ADP-ribosylglycohydrolase [Dehalogenimonas alkenigignens]|uniref:ADP-ribosylglycohydrolase n=1 Tax=Dehalogenimonas alkenigignens TaxID=1217799 RepID=A0A0W0GKU4_9CHLR|nr:ADP-ribosylglycohydrolase family protein [Dehalogenimonas alkenigignens]KTB49144.1 ADP-ribosylglycohydrolase [Dehalogenimonas alkenigignens]
MADNNTIKLKATKAVGAMLGAAYGDALGWPNERVTKSNASGQTQGRLHDFRRWTYRLGGRYFPYEEIIEAGEYSDDTQLILCLSRSLQKGEVWWDYFTQVELPFWSVYERGGGGATKRAVDSWLDGVSPWSSLRKPQDLKKYFDAGGNGVAMRVLPHVLRLAEKGFSKVAANIFLDGVATHGHPRALLGALAYGFALWTAFRKESKLTYGELVEELISNVTVWSAIPTTTSIYPAWMNQADKILPGYSNIWDSVKAEVLRYLDVCRGELAKGALIFDEDVLKELHCFDNKISGAGTVAAIAAVYLASRHAADPLNGVVKAAFAIGSDTDTIASMAGGLLGCVHGSDWLSPVKQGIQDAAYIEKSAFRLANGHIDDKPDVEGIKRYLLKKWIDGVVTAPDSSEVELPDHRKARINHDLDYIGRNGTYRVEFRRLTVDDGQSIYLDKVSKGNFGLMTHTPKQIIMPLQQTLSNSRGCGSKIPVVLFERAIWFYRECLGLTVKKQSSDAVVFDQGLVLVPLNYANNFPQGIQLRALIYVQATNITERFRRIKESNLQIISTLAPWGKSGMLFFRSLDPDGNIVEVFSADGQ